AQAVWVVKSEVECIVRDNTFALDANISCECLRHAEEQECVVNQVRRNVKKNASAGAGAFAPSTRAKLRTKTIVIRLEANDAPQQAARNKLHDSLKITVVTAILIDGEHATLLFCELDEIDCLFESCREGLVDEHIASGSQALMGKGVVRIVRRGDDHEANFFDREQFIERADNANIGILFRGFFA